MRLDVHFSQQRLRFNPGLFLVAIMVHEVALEQTILPTFFHLPLLIIPPLLYIQVSPFLVTDQAAYCPVLGH
jgi:hypothetical protein